MRASLTRYRALIVVGVLALIFVAAVASGVADDVDPERVRAAIVAAGPWGVGLFVVMFVVGELIHIPHQQQMHAGRNSFEQMIGEHQVEHGCFIHNQQVTFQRMFVIAFKGHALIGLKFKQPVQRFGFLAGGFSQALGGAARGRGQQHAAIGLCAQLDDGAHGGGFAGARATG